MGRKYETVEATLAHTIELAGNVRDDDPMDSGQDHPVDILATMAGYMAGENKAWSILGEGKVLCMFGLVAPMLLGSDRYIWLIGSKDLEKHPVAFARISKMITRDWARQYRLVAFVDASFKRAIRWAEWSGFSIGREIEIGKRKVKHYLITMEQH